LAKEKNMQLVEFFKLLDSYGFASLLGNYGLWLLSFVLIHDLITKGKLKAYIKIGFIEIKIGKIAD
jgi:hypothetical protein